LLLSENGFNSGAKTRRGIVNGHNC
jgi:hypothetical protein